MTYDISKHKTFGSQRREEKRERRYTYNTYNCSEPSDIRIQRSLIVSKTLWDSAKQYAHFLEISASVLTERALSEFMVRHASELPVKASFSLPVIPEKPKLCGVKGCRDPAAALGIYRPKNREYALCEIHLAEAKSRPETWKVIEP